MAMAAEQGAAGDGRTRVLGSGVQTQQTDEIPDINVQDDFDPFDSYCELPEESIDAHLSVPAQNEWYHGELDRHSAEMRLLNSGTPGSYLVRESESKPGSYVLSYMGMKGINHFRITAVCGDFYVGGRQFQSLHELIGYYTHVSNILKNERLQYPVAPPEPVDDKKRVIANLPYTKVPDTDELSFVAGEVFIVHNELGGGWLWVTSQKTGESGIIVEDLVSYVDEQSDIHEGKCWYHGSISKDDAAELLCKEGDVGSFLIRNSDKNPGDYSLSFRGPNKIQRFRIQKFQRQYMMGGRYYNSLDDVVEHYRKEEIIDSHYLVSPIEPLKYRKPQMTQVDSSPVIYEEIKRRRSSGFGLHLMSGGTSDAVIKQGNLSKRSQKHKKWKVYFFILNSTKQHLYYFDNEKRTKPRGVIDLGYASVYTVHESLFNQPNCFQIVVKVTNDMEVYYLNAETQQLSENKCTPNYNALGVVARSAFEVLRQEWIEALRSCCSRAVWPTITQRTQTKRGVKQLKSLKLHILEAHKVPPKVLSHPYCVVSLNEIKVARTPVQHPPDPVWDEEFMFDDFPDDIDSFTLDIYNGAKRAKSVPILRASVLLHRLPNGQFLDEWYPLLNVSAQLRGDTGSIRARAQYLQETLMPSKEYSPLKELIMNDEPEYQTILALEEACAKDRSHLASILLDIFRHEQRELSLLEHLNRREIQREEERSTLFRSNTLATTMMDKYMKTTANSFVQHAIKKVVLKIMDAKCSCELNPLKLDKGADAADNLEHLIGFLTEIIESIFNSANECPRPLRYLCYCLQRDVREKWPDDNISPARAVGGFIFLRLICPAILNPRLFNIVSENPSPMAARTLMMVVKAIQNLANHVEFVANYKEPFMEAINPFIVINKGRMTHFFLQLANVPEMPPPTAPPSIDLSRQLAALHQMCVAHIKELQQLSTIKPSLKKLLAVTEMLSQSKNQYIGEVKPPSRESLGM